MTKYAQAIIISSLLLWLSSLILWFKFYPVPYLIFPFLTLTYIFGIILWLIKRSRYVEAQKNMPQPMPEPVDMSTRSIAGRLLDSTWSIWHLTTNPILFVIFMLIAMICANSPLYESHLNRQEWELIKIRLDTDSQLDSTFGKSRYYTFPEWEYSKDKLRYSKIHTEGNKALGSFLLYPKLNKIDSLQVVE